MLRSEKLNMSQLFCNNTNSLNTDSSPLEQVYSIFAYGRPQNLDAVIASS